MGQSQVKSTNDQLKDNLQDSPMVENSVVTEATYTVVASDSNAHHNFNLPSIQDSHSQGIISNSLSTGIDLGGAQTEKVVTFTSDGNNFLELIDDGIDEFSSDNFTICLTSSTTIDFTNNSLASSLAGLTIRDNSDNRPTASVVQATSIKNPTVKEIHNGLSTTIEDNNNIIFSQITNDVSTTNIGSTITSNLSDSIHKKSSKEIKSTLADEAEYTIPPAIAEDVLREMLANKPSQDLLEELEPPSVTTNGKGDNSSSKFKGDSVNHEKIGESSEQSKNSVKKNNLLISSGMTDSPFPSKFTFPNIADKNFFVPNFSTPPVTTSPSSFSFGHSSELPLQNSLQNTFQNPSISSSNSTITNISQQKDHQRRVTLQWHPPVLDKFSPVLSSKAPSITMPSSSMIWPPSINTTSPTDTQFSNSNLLFPQFTGSFKFDMNSKNIVIGTQGSSNIPSPLIPPTNVVDNNNITTNTATVPMSSDSTNVLNAPLSLSSTASTSRRGIHPNVGVGRTTTLYVPAKSPIKSVPNSSGSNHHGNIKTPLVVSPPSKLPMKFGDISISSTSLTSAAASAKGITINVNGSNSNSNSSSTIQTTPSPRGFIHNATNAPTQRQIKELPRRAKFRFNIKSEIIVPSSLQPSLPVIPPSPLFSFATPVNSEDDDDFDAEEDDGSNANCHTDWLDNANNKKKRKALQTVGGSSTTSGGVGGVMKTLTTKERANPLRRVERRSTQRSNVGKLSSSSDSMLPFDSKVVSKELDGMRPPQTTFDFSFKSISEKSAAAAAASVNAASAKRLAAVSPIQTMNAKNDPFSSSLFLQQSSSTVTTVAIPSNTKKKVSTKRAAPSSTLFKNEDVISANNNHVHPQFVKTLKALPQPPTPAATPKRMPNADIQHISNNNASRRKIKFPEKNGDWICMFCEYRLYYGDGRRLRRRPKNNINSNNGDGGGGFNTPSDGGLTPDKALAT
ncbi:7925_t:CDS:2 [Funneliformis mosseae]|uniref:7925_t:CDS:1 n=1 Tax=Funneliformis mosseae TaxID=27381 RepID=A0A9N9ADX4_FUNMO|nr:7925_t:CDS:2 [Funneliformis mosseae]